MGEIWRNWSGTATCELAAVATPSNVDQLAETVRTAAAKGQRVKPIGAGHSFKGDRVDRRRTAAARRAVRPGRGRFGHRPGHVVQRHPVARHPRRHQPARAVDDQSRRHRPSDDQRPVSTGTHGTGARFGGIPTQLRGLEIVTADGSVVSCSATERPELFEAARLGLGALGVISKVTIQCEPQFGLEAHEWPMRLSDVLEAFHEIADDNDHFEFFWFPHTDRVLAKRNNRVPVGAGLRPLSRFRSYLDDELLSNGVFRMTCEVGHRLPLLIPTINQIASRALSERSYSDIMHKVLIFDRRVRMAEMEYALPREILVDVIREIEALIERRRWKISFPVEVRVAAADDIWMSTAYQRPTAYVAIHQFHRTPYAEIYREIEQIFGSVNGRPHWGKLHALDAATLRTRYEKFDDFCRVRKELDPQHVFGNDYLDRVLG